MAAASLAPSRSPFEYDVFLSFRGPDVRCTFADHLYHALCRSGVRVFRDSEELRAGQKIDELFGVIERSEIFIPIFSENYAHSIWCLKEIGKIVSVAEEGNSKRLILPVFYRIEPSIVRHQTGPFGVAFQKHEQDEAKMETASEWRKALRKVAEFSGYQCGRSYYGYEAPLVEMIAERVLQELKNIPQEDVVLQHLVGIKSRADDIIKMLDVNSNDAKMVGIHGMGGLGKTTVAKAVYNKIHGLFKFHAFIGDIREESSGPKGLVKLQSQLVFQISKAPRTICNTSEGTAILEKILQSKRVLIILDDVDTAQQLQALAGRWEWYNPGSRVIITTRDEEVLTALHGWEQHEIYRPKELDEDESLQLFSLHAFGENSPADGYLELSTKIVGALHGLPLAIKTLASTLYGNRDTKDWEGIMKTIRRFRDDRIYRALKVSYDQLSNSDQRSIFLDVACFFSGIDEETAVCIWDACGFSSRLSIKALVHKSLIKKIDGKLEMHDMLREMGKRIVEEEPGTGPEMRSRLWIQEEIMDVLEQQKGTSKIEGINLDKAECGEYDHNDSDEKRPVIKAAGLASMDKLRLLVMNHVNIKGRCKRMPKRIKGLQWQRCPLKFLPSDFHLKHVAALNLSYSNIIEVQRNYNKGLGILKWLILGGRKVKGPVFQNLKVLDLTACNKLTVTPNLSAFPGLEKLVLDGCNNLVKIHESIANLERLVELSMNRCEKLKEMPYCMSRLISLKLLKLADCFSLESLPYYFDKLISLQELDISNCTSLRNVSMNIDRLMALRKVRFDGCYNLEILAQYLDTHCSGSIHGAVLYFPEGLRFLHLDDCQLMTELPAEWIADSCLLEELSLSNCPLITTLPDNIRSLKNLRRLNLSGCSKFQQLPYLVGELESLTELLLENTSLTELPESVGRLKKLEILHLGYCERLERLPSCIGNFESLTQLLLHNTNINEIPNSVTSLQKLELLSVTGCKRLKHLPVGLREDLLLLHGE